MPELYNLETYPQVVDNGEPAVLPGESHDFTDEEVAAGITGSWSRRDPRAGLAVEEEFKKRRKKEADDEEKSEAAESTATQETDDK